jgi:thioredoxin 1
MEVTLTDANFEQEVLKSEKPFLVDFWAIWCGPCKMVSPIVTQLGEEMKDQLRVGKLNVDENPKTSQAYQILSIPSLKIFKDGKILGEIIGAAPKQIIEDKVKAILGLA